MQKNLFNHGNTQYKYNLATDLHDCRVGVGLGL